MRKFKHLIEMESHKLQKMLSSAFLIKVNFGQDYITRQIPFPQIMKNDKGGHT